MWLSFHKCGLHLSYNEMDEIVLYQTKKNVWGKNN